MIIIVYFLKTIQLFQIFESTPVVSQKVLFGHLPRTKHTLSQNDGQCISSYEFVLMQIFIVHVDQKTRIMRFNV